MKPIDFKEANRTLNPPEEMDNCISLRVHFDGEQNISCWKFSFKEIIRMIFDRRIWLYVCGESQPPVWLDTKNPFSVEEK